MRTAHDGGTASIFLKVAQHRLVLLQGIFELYENVAIVRTLPGESESVCVVTTEDLLPDCCEILDSIRGLVGLVREDCGAED